MFQTLSPVPPDPLLGVTEAFRADPSSSKVDLGVGVYRDASGQTPVMAAVRAAEQKLLAKQSTKGYVGQAGNRQFAAALETLALGAGHPALVAKRVATLQAPGGTGALRLGAELLALSGYRGKVLVSDPTWANHIPLMGGAGLQTAPYPYYDRSTGALLVARMLAALDAAEPGTVVLLHGSCHNPTGADLAESDWRAVADVMAQRRLVPFIDIAYQGLGRGLDQDAHGMRLLAERLPELVVAVSCSKNFGLYRERVGALTLIAENSAAATTSMGHLQSLARRNYSMPPDHGAAIVAGIFADETLKAQWLAELTAMRERVMGLRRDLAAALRREFGGPRFDFVAGQNGMFSVLGLSPEAVQKLRNEHHVYTAPDSRVNIAGLTGGDIDAVAKAVRLAVG
ncbi:MAG: aspartate/tyrosine/aromatic aminotransferase [Gammaproteobacteria bacterium]|nr:aspartate/tyrosine/aromatic aminotransferase [Gammaproteobacteria bacterium]